MAKNIIVIAYKTRDSINPEEVQYNTSANRIY